MDLFLGGIRMRRDVRTRITEKVSDAYVEIAPTDEGTRLTVSACDGTGQAFRFSRDLRGGEEAAAEQAGAYLRVGPAADDVGTAGVGPSDLLVALYAFGPDGVPVLDFQEDRIVTTRELTVQVFPLANEGGNGG